MHDGYVLSALALVQVNCLALILNHAHAVSCTTIGLLFTVLRCAGGDMPQKQKVFPQGCTTAYASPQQLYARQIMLLPSEDASAEAGSTDQQQQQSTDAAAKGNKLRHRLASLWRRGLCRGKGSAAVDEDEYYTEDDYTMDGPTVDVYSAGVVLYEMVSFPAVAVR